MRIRTVVTLFLVALPVLTHAEQPLCPPRVVGPNGPEELLMHERDFTPEEAQNSVIFLRTDFAKRIWGPDAVKDLGASSEHYISYANSLRFIEGVLLKDRALHLRAQSQLLARDHPSSSEARAAHSAYENAKRTFCTFVQNSIYVD